MINPHNLIGDRAMETNNTATHTAVVMLANSVIGTGGAAQAIDLMIEAWLRAGLEVM